MSRGKTADSKSSARNRCNAGGTFWRPRRRSTCKARVTFQRQRTWNIGIRSTACSQQLAQIVGRHNGKQAFDRKAVLRADRQHVAVVVRGRLQLEIERAAEAFPHGEAPRAVHRTAEGSVHDQLHAARLVEKPLEDDATTGGQQSESPPSGRPRRRRSDGPPLPSSRSRRSPNVRPSAGSFSRGSRSSRNRETSQESSSVRPGASPSQKRNGGRGTARVGHVHLAAADVQDLPRRIAQQEHVAPHALDGEVFVERADDGFVRFGDDAVRADVGNRAGVGDRGQTCAPCEP